MVRKISLGDVSRKVGAIKHKERRDYSTVEERAETRKICKEVICIMFYIKVMSTFNEQIEPTRLLEIKQKLHNQQILFAKKAIKINKKNKGQERIIVITNYHFYNFEKSTVKRTIKMLTIEAISVSLNSNQLVIHVPSQYDYRYQSQSRNQIVHRIIQSRQKLTQYDALKLFTHKQILLDFVTTTEDDHKKMKSKLPKTQPIFVFLQNFHLAISKDVYSLGYPNEKLLYIASDHVLNYNKRPIEYIRTLNKQSIQEVSLIKCKKTNQYFVSKEFKKEYLNIEVEAFRNILMNYGQSFAITVFVEKLCAAIQRQSCFILLFEYYPCGDLYSQLNIFGVIDQDLIRHAFIRMLVTIQHLNNVFAPFQLQNIVADKFGNTFLSFFNQYLKVQFALQYLSPEQICNQPYNDCKMTNLWKLGILAYEMAYGIPPFNFAELCDIIAKKKQVNLVFPKQYKRSREFQDLLINILRKNPKQRIGGKNFINQIKQVGWLRSTPIPTFFVSNNPRDYYKPINFEENHLEKQH